MKTNEKNVSEKMKKGAAFFLVTSILILGAASLASCQSMGLRYVLNEDKASYSVKGMASNELIGLPKARSVTIPKTHWGKPVTAISDWGFEYYRNLTELNIPDSVTTIGEGAFYDCESLASVTLPSGLQSFGGRVFMGCVNLKSLEISENCAAFTTEDGVLYNKDKTVLVQYPNAKAGDFTVPDGVTELKTRSFLYAEELGNVTVADSVTVIGFDAFALSSLTGVTFGSGLTEIGRLAFSYCPNLERVEIPENVTKLGDDVFLESKALKDITVSENNPNYRSIDGNLYTKDGKRLLQYAVGKTDEAFVLPEETETVEGVAFCGAASLKEVTMSGVIEIKDRAFIGCRALEKVTFGENLTTIEESVFDGCSKIESITIPASVKYIGTFIFHNCSSEIKVIFENTEGWKVTKYNIYTGKIDTFNPEEKEISSAILSNPRIAGMYLWDEYKYYVWERAD